MEIIETSKDTEKRFAKVSVDERGIKKGVVVSNYVTVDSSKTFQTFKGFGGAITESVGYVLSFLDKDQQRNVLQSYFNSDLGNGYVFTRTHLNSCDFSLENWSCLPEPESTIEDFSMERPEKYLVPALKLAVESTTGELKVMLTPWSPSPWMKTNNEMNHGGKLKEEYKTLWAQCYVKYIQELKARGINVELVSIQNEPAAVQTWDSCEYSAEEEGKFAVEYLSPALKQAGLDNIKILAWDHNREILKERMEGTLAVPGAKNVIDGCAFHWYSGDQYDQVKWFSENYPEKELVFTEGCVEFGPRNGKWFTGERYAHNIINDLNNGCTAWIDWNLVLDMEGGPNHVHNYCDAPVLIDTYKKQIHYQSSYYYIGHFSRYIKPGAVRLESNVGSWMLPSTVDGKIGNCVECCAFKNPDGSIVMVLTNRTEDLVNFELNIDGEKKELYIPERTIQTYVIK